MRNRTVATWLILSLALAGATVAEELDDVLSRHVEARGGLPALEGVETYRATGVMRLNAEMHGGVELEGAFTIDWARPDRVRMEFTLQGNAFIQATDGETAWSLAPAMGQTSPQTMAQDELAGLLELADLVVGPLVAPEAHGVDVRLVGEGEIDGTDVIELAVAWPDERQATFYLDRESALPIELRGRRSMHGNSVELSRSLGQYKAVDGILLPHFVELSNEADVVLQTFTIERIELGVSLDGRFAMPTEAGASR